MKRTLSIFLAALLVFWPLCSAVAAAGKRAAAADIFETPAVQLTGQSSAPNDVILSFAADCGSAAAYERQRRSAYDKLFNEIASVYEIKELNENVLRQLGMEDLIPLLYPVALMAELTVDGITVYMDSFPADETAFNITLNADVLPALVRCGLYTHEAFTYTLSFSLVIENDTTPTRASGSTEAGPFACPATAHLRYDVPADAVNPNPEFMFLPYDDYTLLLPTRTGYTFSGWVDQRTGGYVKSVAGNTLDRAFFSFWTPRVYKVNYVLTTRPGYFVYVDNSGNPLTHIYGDETPLYDVNPPYGYLFMGWYLTADFSGPRVTSIPADTPNDVILYAKWLTQEEKDAEAIAAGHWGDLDDDGNVTAGDARLALRAAVQLETLSPWQLKRADLAGNGVVSAATARDLLRIAVGLDSIADVLRFYGTI